MIDNIEITISDQPWPKLRLVIKSGVKVQTAESLHTTAPTQFGEMVRQFISSVVEVQTKRRTTHGST